MNIVCIDMESVLTPEIWVEFAEKTHIPELRRTTREEPDYEKLMAWRLDILRRHGLGLADIQQVIAQIDPLDGAREFLDALRGEYAFSYQCRVDESHSAVRFCTSWATRPEDVRQLIADLRAL